MSRIPYRDDEGSRAEFLRFLVEQGEEPAFLRRAKEVDVAWEDLLRRCLFQRDEMLRWPRMHLGDLARKVGDDWSRLAAILPDQRQASALAALYEEWKPKMPPVVEYSGPWATLRSALVGYIDAARRFNVAWEKYLSNVDVSEINRIRSDYNKYYPVEKAAAFESEDIDRLGFAPLEMATVEMLRANFPPLEVPEFGVTA